jgi:UDP:flavonoid glycosyltransferase YjiC (YdhE family)
MATLLQFLATLAWRKRRTLGCFPRWRQWCITAKKLTAEKLAAAIQMAVTDTSMQTRATEIGRKIRAEDGIANAIEIINQISA